MDTIKAASLWEYFGSVICQKHSTLAACECHFAKTIARFLSKVVQCLLLGGGNLDAGDIDAPTRKLQWIGQA
jgi:hypothetical protein